MASFSCWQHLILEEYIQCFNSAIETEHIPMPPPTLIGLVPKLQEPPPPAPTTTYRRATCSDGSSVQSRRLGPPSHGIQASLSNRYCIGGRIDNWGCLSTGCPQGSVTFPTTGASSLSDCKPFRGYFWGPNREFQMCAAPSITMDGPRIQIRPSREIAHSTLRPRKQAPSL